MNILKKIISNPTKTLTEGKNFVAGLFKSVTHDEKIFKEYQKHLPNIITTFDTLSYSLKSLNSQLKNYNIKPTDINTAIVSTNNKNINMFFNNILKIITTYQPVQEILREKGIISVFIMICNAWEMTLTNIQEVISDDNYTSGEEGSKFLKLSQILDVAVLSIAPATLFILSLSFKLICDIFGEDVEDTNIGILTQSQSKQFETLMKFIIEIGFTNGKNIKLAKKNIKSKGLDFNIFSKSHNPFDILRLSDFTPITIKTLQLLPCTKSFFVGELLIWYKTWRIDKIKEKKEWMEQRVLLLKMKLSGKDPNDPEVQKLKEAIEYYENKIAKLNKKLDDIYDV